MRAYLSIIFILVLFTCAACGKGKKDPSNTDTASARITIKGLH